MPSRLSRPGSLAIASSSSCCTASCFWGATNASKSHTHGKAGCVTSSGVCRGPQHLRLAHHRAQHAQRLGGGLAARCEVVERDAVDGGLGVGEVGEDLDQVHVADDEPGRGAPAPHESRSVGGRRRRDRRARPLYYQPKTPRFQTSAALVPPVLVRAAPGLEAVPLAGRVGVVGRRHAEHAAEVDEVLLRGGLSCAARSHATSRRSRRRRASGGLRSCGFLEWLAAPDKLLPGLDVQDSVQLRRVLGIGASLIELPLGQALRCLLEEPLGKEGGSGEVSIRERRVG